jgi:hypothetical protein
VLLELLAAEPAIPECFREACLRLSQHTDSDRGPVAAHDFRLRVLTGLAANPTLSPEHAAALAALSDTATPTGRRSSRFEVLLYPLLRRPGVTAATAVGLLPATASVSVLRHALRYVPDPDGVLARDVLARSHAVWVLTDLLREASATSPVTPASPAQRAVARQAALLLAADQGGCPRRLSVVVRRQLTDLAARTPGLRAELLEVTTHPQLRATLTDHVVRAQAQPVPPEPGSGWSGSAVEGWLLRADTTAAAAAVVLRRLGEVDLSAGPAALVGLWRFALRVVPDPEGVLAAAACTVIVGAREIRAAVVVADQLPVAARRHAALLLLTSGAGGPAAAGARAMGQVVVGAIRALVAGADPEWLRAVALAARDAEVLCAVLEQPGIGSAESLRTAAVALGLHPRSGALDSRSFVVPVEVDNDRLAFAYYLLRCPQAPAELRAGAVSAIVAARRLWEPSRESGRVQELAFWTSVADAVADSAGTGPVDRAEWAEWAECAGDRVTGDRVTGEVGVASPRPARLVLDLPMPQWNRLYTGPLNAFGPWAGQAAGEIAAELADPVVAAAVLEVAAAGTFTGSLADLVAVAAGLTAP